MRLLRSFVVTCALFSLSVAAMGAQSKTDAESTFNAGTAEWAAAYNAGEPERIVALYTDDAVVMPPDAPSVTGHAALRTYLAKDIAAARKAGVTLAITGDDAGSSGDLGWHRGTFDVVGAGNTTVVTGKFLELWERQGGKWRITQDIWNNDAPAVMPAAAEAGK